ncbi:uncharacterized protein LOC142227394 [Haematobia irritans]|uniref:uncharacterized protein LOC142227394 n=1 Tax=Haematobia irritans TaxID=7368 RepID=UPI003F4FDD22
MGAELNSALKILVSPKKPEELSYEEIKSTLINHYDDTPRRGRIVGKTFIAPQKSCSIMQIGSVLHRMLIEQLIFGMESRIVCDEVFTKQPKSFAEAYEIASSKELTLVSTGMVNTSDNSITEPTFKLGFIPVKTKKQVTHKSNSTAETSCYGCGGQHTRKDCKFRNEKCITCGKVGHISKMCKSSTRQISESVGEEAFVSDCHCYDKWGIR